MDFHYKTFVRNYWYSQKFVLFLQGVLHLSPQHGFVSPCKEDKQVEDKRHWFKRIKIVYILVTSMKILDILSVILTVVDMASDVILAVDYCVTDNPWWCGLTWTFIVIPPLLGLFLLSVFVSCSAACEGTSTEWRVWKGIEICFESGPQLILQLYIILQSDVGSSVISGKTYEICWAQMFVYMEGWLDVDGGKWKQAFISVSVIFPLTKKNSYWQIIHIDEYKNTMTSAHDHWICYMKEKIFIINCY